MKIPYSRSDIFLIGSSLTLTVLGFIAAQSSPNMVWGAWFFAACLTILVVAPILQARNKPRKERVEFDALSIRRYFPNGQVERIAWNELAEIWIVTTDEGPLVDDVFWVFT